MDIDVDVLGVYVKIEEIGHLLPLRHQPVVGRHDSLVEIGVLHVSPIDKEILMGSLLLGRLGLPDKASDLANRGLHVHGQQVLVEPLAEYVHNALPEIASMQTEYLRAVAMERESYLGIYQGDALEGCKDIVQLRGIGFQELPARGYIIKYIAYGEDTTHGTRARLLLLDPGTGNGDLRPHLVGSLARLEHHLRYGSDGSQGLAAEPHRMKGEEVVGLAYLRGGMAFEGQAGIRLRHSLSIINYLNVGATGISHYDMDVFGTGIDSVLHQFLDD